MMSSLIQNRTFMLTIAYKIIYLLSLLSEKIVLRNQTIYMILNTSHGRARIYQRNDYIGMSVPAFFFFSAYKLCKTMLTP